MQLSSNIGVGARASDSECKTSGSSGKKSRGPHHLPLFRVQPDTHLAGSAHDSSEAPNRDAQITDRSARQIADSDRLLIVCKSKKNPSWVRTDLQAHKYFKKPRNKKIKDHKTFKQNTRHASWVEAGTRLGSSTPAPSRLLLKITEKTIGLPVCRRVRFRFVQLFETIQLN